MSDSISSKIAQATFEHLDKNLPLSFYANDFSTQQYESLLKHLFGLFGEESSLSHTAAIKKGFKRFFAQTSQEIGIHLDAKEIRLSKSRKREGISIVLDKALFNLDDQLLELSDNKKEFELRSYLYQFPPDKLQTLMHCFSTLDMDLSEVRSHIREETELQFPLQARDIILFFSEQMYIRLFVPLKSKPGLEQRFNGYDPEELTKIYESTFTNEFSKRLLDMIPELEASSLNFSRLDNVSFHTKLPDTFRSFLDVAMLPFVEHLDEETTLALNGYVLRLNFDHILGKLSDILMQKVYQRDKQAEKFLKYYNGETVMDSNGKKIKKNSIVDSVQNTWNYSAIFSILTQYKQAQNMLQTQQKSIDEKKSIFIKIENENKALRAEYTSLSAQADQSRSAMVKQKLVCDSLKADSLKSKEDAMKSELRICLAELNKKEKEYDILKSSTDSFKIRLENHTIETSNRKQHYIKAQERMLQLEKSFDEIYRSYKLIRAALAKVITGR